MRPDHDVLNYPLKVEHRDGRLKVLRRIADDQSGMGEALTLDGIVNSIDAELIAKGTSAKGPERGAIVRHGPYTLWGFEGPVDGMTEAGKRLFVNTVVYAARQVDSAVLERRITKTRDEVYHYLMLAEFQSKGFLGTLKQYLPRGFNKKSWQEIVEWADANRPYLRAEGRIYEVDEFAKEAGIPNHSMRILEYCISNLRQGRDVKKSLETLTRYTGQQPVPPSADAWQAWYEENRDYLFFSDTDGYRFIIDTQAKTKKIPSRELRGWSSERVDYRADPGCAKLKAADREFFVDNAATISKSDYRQVMEAIDLIVTFTDYTRNDTTICDLYKRISQDRKDREKMLQHLEDKNAMTRIMAAAVLSVDHGLPRDFAYDALDEDPSVRVRAAKATEAWYRKIFR
ncbi:MAG TPA: hypothetical protein P5279_09795 [Anaerohalosphaeraceae bacterium]|nr:hypothetical protein [Anaerohalosphaeraceae bacterium]HRT50775.1 hypothetical protein [Anaerohalosphaeraceae bacterium]HRT86811.1 hypothetical protein [Anaerohalosphaeraceae bacterium]